MARSGSLQHSCGESHSWLRCRFFWAAIAFILAFANILLPSNSQLAHAHNTSGVSGALGFDVCDAPTTGHMNTWWHNSPFWNVGVYIGGSNRACDNDRLDTDWIHTVIGQGWNVVPIFNGPHPPCGTGDKFSSSTPNADGVDQAVLASNHAQSIHINPNNSGAPPVIYYDLENWDPNNTSCNNDTKSFINGWVNKLHDLGYNAGVYASGCSGVDQLWGINDTPDQLWVADFNHDHEDVWGLTCSGAGVPNTHWNGSIDRRQHQYAGNVSKTYGGVTLLVDFNCLNGRAVPDGDGEDVYDDPHGTDPDNESLGGTLEDAQCAGPYPTH